MNKNRFGYIGEYFRSERSFDLKIYFFLFIITIAGYYAVSLFIHPLKWDMIDQYYPYRYLTGECLKNNFFPYWQPYQLLGIPFYADPSSGVWYPITWIIGFFSGYNVYALSFEFMLHIFLASVGFYLLSKNLGLSKWIALILSVAYSFSGFFVGNAQHITYVISATWTPFVLNSFIALIKNKKGINAVAVSFFLFLMTTGGYPAFGIILFYHLLAIFIGYSIYLLIRKERKELLRFFKMNLITVFVYGLLALSFFVSVLYNKGQIGRFSTINLEDILFSPFSPKCMVSFITPYAVAGNADYFNTDLSMSNAYFGIFSCAFFLLYFFQKKSKLSILILIAGILNLLAAFGGYLPFREFLYHYVPFMDLFRFPSVFRYFTIVAFLLVSGFSIQHFMEHKNKKLFFMILALVCAFVIIILIARSMDYLNLKNMATDLAWKFPNGSTIAQRIAFQLIIQSGLLLLFLLFYRFSKIKFHYLLLCFVLLDMFMATRLNAPATVYYEEYNSKDIRAFEKQNFVSGFPVPDRPIREYSDTTGYYKCFWRNLSSMYKRPAFDGYNSFHVKEYETLSENHSRFFKEIKKNKLFYFADTAIFKFDSLTALKYGRPGMVFIEDDFSGIHITPLKNKAITITSFSPEKIEVTAECNDEALLVFMQNYNKGWKATVNNKEVKIHKANLTLNAIMLPPGTNQIIFSYKPVPVTIARYISFTSLLFVLFYLLFMLYRKPSGTKSPKLPEAS
ncbi:MAG TPA: YfhO family protein [Bacteroidales bacterium]|nr:YfhO family protein [Bacteroidales bacterium]